MYHEAPAAVGSASRIGELGTILGIWAHPDDEAYLSGGLMALARDAQGKSYKVRGYEHMLREELFVGAEEHWESTGQAVQGYTAGTWGPSQAIALIERDGRTWHEG